MNWLDKLSQGKSLKKSRVDPLPIGNLISDAEMLNNFAHETPSKQKSLTPGQVKRFRKDLMRRGYNAKQATKYSNKALNLSKKHMNEPDFPGKSRLYGKFDFDGDGVPNDEDCYPFDKDRQGIYYTGRRNSGGGKIYAISSSSSRSSGGSSGGGGSSYSAPKPTTNWNTVNVGQVKAAGYTNLGAYKAAVNSGKAAAPTEAGRQDVIKSYQPGGSNYQFGGNSSIATKAAKDVYVPLASKYNNTFTTNTVDVSMVGDIEGVTSNKIARVPVGYDDEGKPYYATLSTPDYEVQESYTIGYEPVYGTYTDEAEYEAKRAELIEQIYGKALEGEQARYDKAASYQEQGLLKKQKKLAALGGASSLTRRKKSKADFRNIQRANRINSNLENLRSSLYGEQEASENNKALVAKTKKDFASLRASATKSYITGEQGAPIRGTRTVTVPGKTKYLYD